MGLMPLHTTPQNEIQPAESAEQDHFGDGQAANLWA
jgi:hypothetical protein